jgi:hypothetical protein
MSARCLGERHQKVTVADVPPGGGRVGLVAKFAVKFHATHGVRPTVAASV